MATIVFHCGTLLFVKIRAYSHNAISDTVSVCAMRHLYQFTLLSCWKRKKKKAIWYSFILSTIAINPLLEQELCMVVDMVLRKRRDEKVTVVIVLHTHTHTKKSLATFPSIHDSSKERKNSCLPSGTSH